MQRLSGLPDDVQRLRFEITSESRSAQPSGMISSGSSKLSRLSSEQNALIARLNRNKDKLTAEQRLQLHQIMQLTTPFAQTASYPSPSLAEVPSLSSTKPWTVLSPLAPVKTPNPRVVPETSRSEARLTKTEKRHLIEILKQQQKQIESLERRQKRSRGCGRITRQEYSRGTGSFITAESNHTSSKARSASYQPSPRTRLNLAEHMTHSPVERHGSGRKWYSHEAPDQDSDVAWLQSFLQRDKRGDGGNLMVHRSLRSGTPDSPGLLDLFESDRPENNCRSRSYWERVVCCKP